MPTHATRKLIAASYCNVHFDVQFDLLTNYMW